MQLKLKQIGKNYLCNLEKHREFNQRIKYICVERQCKHEFRVLCEDCYNELHNGHRIIDLIEAEKLAYQMHSARLSKLKTHITQLNDMLQHSIKTIKQTLKQLQLQFNQLIQEEIELLQSQTLQQPTDLNEFVKQLVSEEDEILSPRMQKLAKGVKSIVLKSFFLTSDISVFSYKDYLNLPEDSLTQIKRFDILQKVLLEQVTYKFNVLDNLQIFNTHPKKVKFQNLIHVYCMDVTQDGNLIAAGGHPDTVIIVDPATQTAITQLKTSFLEVISVQFSMNGKRLAAGGSYPFEIYVWNCRNWEAAPLILKAHHLNQINRMVFHWRHLYVASDDYKVRVWKLNKQGATDYKEYVGHWDSVFGLAVNGRKLASTGRDKTIAVWEKDKLVKQWVAHDCQFGGYCLDYSLDGRLLISTGYDNMVRIWNAENGYKIMKQFSAHHQAIWTLGFLPNINMIATASWDNTIKIWDVQLGKCVFTLENQFHSCPTINMKCFPQMFIANGEGFVLIWSI